MHFLPLLPNAFSLTQLLNVWLTLKAKWKSIDANPVAIEELALGSQRADSYIRKSRTGLLCKQYLPSLTVRPEIVVRNINWGSLSWGHQFGHLPMICSMSWISIWVLRLGGGQGGGDWLCVPFVIEITSHSVSFSIFSYQIWHDYIYPIKILLSVIFCGIW